MALPSNQCPRKSLSEEILHAVDQVLWPANLFGKAGADLRRSSPVSCSSNQGVKLDLVYLNIPINYGHSVQYVDYPGRLLSSEAVPQLVTEAVSLRSCTAKVRKSLSAAQHISQRNKVAEFSPFVTRICAHCDCQCGCVCVCVCFCRQYYLHKWIEKD